MRYQSTRGEAPIVSFAQAMLTGLAPDGGLYWPQSWPKWSKEDWYGLRGQSYEQIGLAVMKPFLGGTIADDELLTILQQSYQGFRHPAVAPLRQLDENLWHLELFHGPTWSFKDYALQLLARLMERQLRLSQKQVVIIGATSGDTGSAAIEACRGRQGIRVVMLHPKGRVSEIQRRQMTTIMDDNIHNIAIDGSFDDCQDLVKAMFADETLRTSLGLSAVNSINWLRILAQMVYYAATGISLGDGIRPFGVAVPTGNFGNILAAWCVRQMGLPIQEMVIGSNQNDILTRFIHHNDMRLAEVKATTAPAMDIQISSNFERYLFELVGRDGTSCAKLMRDFRQTGHLSLNDDLWRKACQVFRAAAYDDQTIASIIAAWAKKSGIIIEPHSAIAVQAALDCRINKQLPFVAVASAHPAKFADSMKAALGYEPEIPAPLAALLPKQERCHQLSADANELKAFLMALPPS